MKHTFSLIALVAAFPALAEDTRQLDAHEHGVGTLNIAVEGATVVMEFEAPGADIVGFEYAAESNADLAAIDAAVVTLGTPLDLFMMPAAAGCVVVEARAELEGEDGHEDHDDHTDEKHEEHAEEGHDDHGHEDHDNHAEEAGHTEFHAEYMLTCEAPDALAEITFAYFEAFPNAQEVEVQVITASGAQAFEVTRDAPVLDLGR
jgi:hypothetical protein